MPHPALIDAHAVGMGETGNETWARNVVRELETDGGPRFHVALTAAGQEELGLPPERLHVVSGSSARRLAVDLPRALRDCRASAVVAQYTLPLSRVPGVVVVHDVSFLEPEARDWIPPRTLLRYRSTIGVSVRRARAVVVPTSYTRTRLCEHYGTDGERVLVAPLAVDPSMAARLSHPRRTRERSTVLCVGTLLPRKNLPVVAHAVASLRAAGQDVVLRLVGPVRAAGERDLSVMRDVLGAALQVVGAVSDSELAEEYLAANVLAFPSLYEGFGLPLLEAMAAGTPVVSSSATCLPEVVGDAAILVPPRDVVAWTRALEDVLREPSDLVRRGHDRARSYSWSRTADVVRQATSLASS